MKRDNFKRKGRQFKKGKREDPQSHNPQQGNTEFVYPYNFVPVGDEQKREKFKHLHWFDGLTGRILYKLKTLSPIFIPDPEGTSIYVIGNDKEKDIHRVMNFFNKNGRLCIPSTSIKGMVRNVVEAATNSSFGVFDLNDKKFPYRKDRGFRRNVGIYNNRQIIPAKIAKLPRYALENAIGTILGKRTVTFDDIKQFQDEDIQIKVWKIHTGKPLVVEFQMRGSTFNTVTVSPINSGVGLIQQRPDNSRKRLIVSGSNSYYCPWDPDVYGTLGVGRDWPKKPFKVNFKYADFPEIENFDPGKNIGNNRVIEISFKDSSGKSRRWSGVSSSFIPGRLFLQRFFLDEDVRNSKIQMSERYVYVVYDYSGTPLNISDRKLKDYKDVNDQEPVNGQIVYYETDRSGQVTEFGPVAMFKSAENTSLRDLVINTTPSVLYPHSSDALCPATRLFGWTPEDEQSGEQGIAGRVRFTTAWSDKTLNDTRLVSLKILSAPKPQYYPFYLKAKDGSNKAGYYTLRPENPWAQKEGIIRGRKFYLHHPELLRRSSPEKQAEYLDMRHQKFSEEHEKNTPPTWPHTNQNSTCRVLPSGAEFKGTIEFESLEEHELGMLLWSLTLSDNPLESSSEHAHKIGMGKGIGMGSVRFEIEGVCLEEPEKNWFDPDPEYIDERSVNADDLKRYVMAFNRWLTGDDSNVNNNNFKDIPFIADLLRVLNLNLVRVNTPIRYYRDFADEGYKYFMNQRKKRNRNEEETLKTPFEIEGGGRQSG